MAGIPVSALRRALAEMAVGARSAYGRGHIDAGIGYGGIPGAIAGGALGAQVDDDTAALGTFAGAAGGMLLGGGAGGLAKLAHMAYAGAREGSGGLRQALAERAAARGMGRAAEREVSHLDDAERFEQRFTPGPPREFTSDELRAAGQRPTPIYGSDEWAQEERFREANLLDEMRERQAMREALERLRYERANAKSQEELDDMDMEIAMLRRDLGIIPWD